jgi:6-phosphogluconolactonase
LLEVNPRPDVRVFADAGELAHAAAELVLAHARTAIVERGAFHLALAGGSTPRAAYRELARRGPEAGFEQWHAWFGDERCVPPEDERSNHRMAAESGLLARLPAAQVHRMRGEARDPAREATRYERELCEALGLPPRLDLVLLGLGADGHTASLFPGTPALEARGWVTVGRAPSPPHARLTLTLATLAGARAALFLVAGADKAPALARALADAGTDDLPARHVRLRAGTLQWLVERSAIPEPGGS